MMKKKIKRIVLGILLAVILLVMLLGLNGCTKSDHVNYNIRKDADNFKVYRRVIALNTRTNEALFQVEGLISIATDGDGDLNVTIKTGEDEYKLFYAHLSKDVTYTSVQLNGIKENAYAYKITFFPTKKAVENGIVDLETTD